MPIAVKRRAFLFLVILRCRIFIYNIIFMRFRYLKINIIFFFIVLLSDFLI